MKPDTIGTAGAALVLAALLLPAAGTAADEPPESAPVVLWATVEDVIGPISASYLVDAMAEAEARGAAALVIALDTPGGLDTAMRQIIKAILASPVPVCVYVSPEGARAASAGVYISYSAHVAAMAPGTNLGAATPVNLGGEMDSTLTHKVVNDATAYIQSLARLRGRNEEWATRSVTEALSLPSEEAAAENVVDFVATGPRDLLTRMDGRMVRVAGDSIHVIHTGNAVISEYPLSWRYRVLSALNNPNVAYLLLMLGFYGLFFELSNPGAIFPGVLGGICLILGLFALQNLSLNYAGLLLIVFGAILFFLETQIASHGLLATGGTLSLLAGSLLLIDAPEPYMKVSLRVVVPVVAVTAGFFLFAVTMAVRARRRKVITGNEGLVDLVGTARTALSPSGTVFVAGEHWSATSAAGTIPPGTRVRVVAVDHLRITVRPAAGNGAESPHPSS
jgi:membrane-bound serine protease (ClpP class)